MATPSSAGTLLLEKLDATELASEIVRYASESHNEEDLKIRVEKRLGDILKNWGIETASYEHRLRISGREDALYGTVIIEYKTPGKLDSKAEFSKVKEQVKDYIAQEARTESRYGKFFGVIMDGYKISFVRYRKNEWLEQDEPLQVNGQTILRLLESIRGLRRKPIDAEQLLTDFGPSSRISRKAILALYDSLVDKNTPRTDMLFNDWRRVFSQVCSYAPEKFAKLVEFYGLKGRQDIDVEKLLFSIHTYYTLLMKLLTSEIVTLFADSLLGSYLKRIEEAYYRSKDDLLIELRDLEEGGIFSSLGIRNFLEADYFAWYLDEWNDTTASVIFEITQRLLNYEPATVELNPERVEDLFKRLYQNLVPRDVRHSIGEYFTPDWLAELVLNESGYDGNPTKRLLDPACGSGTFVVLAIRRTREYAEEHFVDHRELLAKITGNIRGIDLNPLAVLASKANYIIALSDLLRYRPREGIDIPIYLADSISVVKRVTPYGEDEFELQTNEGRFWITKEVIDKNLLQPVLSIISETAKADLTRQQFELALSKDIPLRKDSIQSLARLYDKILNLERVGKDRIWTSLLKNSISPLLIGRFDYVVGNPPWINWENLPEFYREATKELWESYGLIGKGAFKRDIAMLFVARCFHTYVADNGKLSFLIPYTTYKTQAGAGFRKYLSSRVQVLNVHDLVELYPFEGAVNRTSLITLEQGKTTFPIPCTIWSNPRSKGMEMDAELTSVRDSTRQFEMVLAPINRANPESSWMSVTKEAYNALEKVTKPSVYEAQEGINSRGADSIFTVQVLRDDGEKSLVRNLLEGKKSYRQKTGLVENQTVFPLLRGRDVQRWYAKPEGYTLVPCDPKTGKILTEDKMKVDYRLAYQFLSEFKKELESRTHYGKSIRSKFEFYTLFQVNKKTFSPYKVCWKYIAGKISGKAEFSVAVVGQEGKAIIPNTKVVFVSVNSEDEAHYIAGVLNSSITQLVVTSYTIETGISSHVLKHVHIPVYDSNNKLHARIVELSRSAHDLAKQFHEKNNVNATTKIEAVEQDIDETVAKLQGVTNVELNDIKLSLRILKEGTRDETTGLEEE